MARGIRHPPGGAFMHKGGQHSPNTPTAGLRERGNDTSRSTGRSGRQNAATRRNMRREERVTVQGPVKEHQPDGMSQRGSPSRLRKCAGCVFRVFALLRMFGKRLLTWFVARRRWGIMFFAGQNTTVVRVLTDAASAPSSRAGATCEGKNG